MRLAALAATRSTCPRRQVGAVLVRDARVIATGYNGSLRGQPHCLDVGCLMVGGHCKRTVHAEVNALLQCARYGVSSDGATLYTTCFPCWDCAQGLVQAGVGRVVFRDVYAGLPGHDEPDALRVQEAALGVLRAAAVDVGRLVG